MAKESKQPIVYVSRKITHFNENNIECVAGYYVSQAYLNFAGKRYEKDGTIKKEFMVDYVNRFEQLNTIGEYQFYSEMSDSSVFKTEVFKRYTDCKIFVNEQNRIFATTVGTTSVSKIEKRMELHKQALKHGAKLEEKFIPLEEREQVSENTNNS